MKVSFFRLRDVVPKFALSRRYANPLWVTLLVLLSAVVMWYRKIPVISLGFIQLHKGFCGLIKAA